MSEKINTIVAGGGQAGLAMSHSLSRLGGEHVVIERPRVAELAKRALGFAGLPP
jgi:putative flavoprotein involved in K+ transport